MHVVDIDRLDRFVHDNGSRQPRVVASGNHAVPWTALKTIDRGFERYRLFMLNAPAGVPDRPGVTLETAFVGAGMRGRPSLAYYPSRLSLVPALLRHVLTPDIVVVHTSVPRDNTVSLGVEVNILRAAIESAHAHGGLVVAQLNRQMPFTYGDAVVSVEDIDVAIEVDVPLGELPSRSPGAIHRRIAANVAALVPEGATLQLGIGAVPDATLGELRQRRGLRVWSEMISDGVLQLERAGALSDDTIITSFAAGSAELYDWLDGNRRVRFLRTERTNDPAGIAQQPAMTSINAALQVDLSAQANASYRGTQIYSGFGGQTDFVVGALHASDGHAIIALPSWHDASDSSTVVERLCCPATSFQHSAIVSEHGVATIWGRSQQEQAQQLVENVAAPAARDALRRAGTFASGR
ncbi:MAG: hypothetical protein QOC82_2822 [Frankiaceae bacterium]|jgi:acyl-CoA hydrolase|nr:hypothetical protein [Frankiaceae bacterium]